MQLVVTEHMRDEIRRAEERVLVDRMMWLAAGSPNSQVRAIASWKLTRLAARLKAALAHGEADQAHAALLSADIKRFLERPADQSKPIVAPDAPPGAPIGGDVGMDWLARPPYASQSSEGSARPFAGQ